MLPLHQTWIRRTSPETKEMMIMKIDYSRSPEVSTSRKWLQAVTLAAGLITIHSVSANERVTFLAGVSDGGGFPGYAQFGYDPLLQAVSVIHDEEWAAIPFYRDPACVPADFNLVTQIDVPRAFGCASTVEGSVTYPASPDRALHVHIQGPVAGFPLPTVYLVRYAELLAAIGDGELLIGELQALPSRKTGRATFFQDNFVASVSNGAYQSFHDNFRIEGIIEGNPEYTAFLVHFSAAGQGEKSRKSLLNPALIEIRLGH
jgi:hypothetical protein